MPYNAAFWDLNGRIAMPASILIVEDDADIRDLLRFTVERAGFEAVSAESAETALNLVDRQTPELAVIDWMLPGGNGVDLVHSLRRSELTSAIPIIMLTARSEESDKLRSFASGVDDYVTKPFSPKELVARIKALLRRTGAPEGDSIERSGISLNRASRRVTVDGQELQIGPTEFRLLEVLMRNPDRAFDRSQLLDRVWGRTVYVEERTVDVHILRLRKLLKPHQRDHLIQTVRGVGYRFAE